MVRFHWHVEQGYSAYMPPDGVSTQKEANVTHASCEVEIPGQKETLPAILTLPPDHLKHDKVKEVGVVIGHGSNATDWQGKFLTELAGALAAEGFLVMRYFCKQKEQRRQKMYEKALDAAATSPFARGVTRWMLAGIGNGARIAAFVGTVCRGDISGFALLSYPLEEPEPLPPGKTRRSLESTPGPADSEGPLLGLQAPVLLVTGDTDDLCHLPHLQKVCTDMKSADTRLVVIKDADANLKSPHARTHSPSAVKDICDVVVTFAKALNDDTLAACPLPKPSKPAPADMSTLSVTKPLERPHPDQEAQHRATAGQTQRHPGQQHSMQQHAVQPHPLHQHPLPAQEHSAQQHAVQLQPLQQHEWPQHPVQSHQMQQHSVQVHSAQQQSVEYAVQQHPMQQHAVQQNTVQLHPMQQHVVRQHAVQQQPVQQPSMQQQPIQTQPMHTGRSSGNQSGVHVHIQSSTLSGLQAQPTTDSGSQPRTALDNPRATGPAN